MKPSQFATALAATTFRGIIASADDLPLPPLPAWYPLEPWQVSSLYTYNPQASPYGANASGLVLTITNPKMIAAVPAPHASGGGYVVFLNSTAHCELHWTADAATPYGHSSNSCVVADDYSHPRWSVTLNEVHEDLPEPGDHYLSVTFELVHNATIYATEGYKRMVGATTFQTGANLQGQCGPDGLCEFELKNGSAPVLLQPTLQECKSECG
ncbi:hypothetical protein F5Y19DRAFT_465929 [Xylariaceae sp. FL1651]|nr:hypothetical protein F5Y19DRAFT_465929 [Xylariaceae sp. FL1651]